MNIASEMAELHTNDLTNLRLIKSNFLFHEIFLQFLLNSHPAFFWRQKYPDKFSEQTPDEMRVNQDVDIDILNKNLCRSLRKTGFSIFMQDGAPCHTAKKVQQWFDDHPWVTLLPWAPQSPDMNIIENLWTLLKQEVAKLPAATNREELKERILSAWKNLGRRRDALKNLCDSMPRRVSALVQTRGGPTKY